MQFPGPYYSSDWTQRIKYDRLCADYVNLHKGVPQCSILGPLMLIMCINDMGQNVSDVNMLFLR